ncbi:MAG: hypothetical protein V3T77_09580, partial [Planctomycetota bacterium]
ARYPAIGDFGVAKLVEHLDAGRAREAARFLLERHYDPRYQHGNQRLRSVQTFEFQTVAETTAEISAWLEEYF